MDKIKQRLSSIQVSLIACIIITLLLAQALYMLLLFIIDNAMMDLLDPRPDSIVFDSGRFITLNFGGYGSAQETQVINEQLFAFLQNLRSLVPILIFGSLVIIATLLYYRIKLKKPLELLEAGIQKIAAEELDFTIETPSGDELGRLCAAFENMRAELQQTFQDLWQSEENQRNLYRAFAHDLRTPLTVIKGSNEIIEFVAAKNEDWNKAIDAVGLSNDAIVRIEQYTEQLKELQSLEDWSPAKTEIRPEDFIKTITQQAHILGKDYGKRISVVSQCSGSIVLDWNGVMRILDNILSNALQYAAEEIAVQIYQRDRELEITVCDDGPGFSPEALKKATTPFWSSDKSGGHIGLGLTIAAGMTGKCGGILHLENHKEHGACAKIILPV